MKPVLVIGYGNCLRGDDGLGWYVAQCLAQKADPAELEVIPCAQLTPDLAESVSRATAVLFIDAVQDGQVGEIRRETVLPSPAPPSFTHHLGPEGLLALAEQLYGTCPEAELFSICGQLFDYSDSLSPAVSARVPGFIAQIEGAVRAMTGIWAN